MHSWWSALCSPHHLPLLFSLPLANSTLLQDGWRQTKRETTCLWLGKESRGWPTFAASAPPRASHLLLPSQSPTTDSMLTSRNVPAESHARVALFFSHYSSAVPTPKWILRGNPQWKRLLPSRPVHTLWVSRYINVAQYYSKIWTIP